MLFRIFICSRTDWVDDVMSEIMRFLHDEIPFLTIKSERTLYHISFTLIWIWSDIYFFKEKHKYDAHTQTKWYLACHILRNQMGFCDTFHSILHEWQEDIFYSQGGKGKWSGDKVFFFFSFLFSTRVDMIKQNKKGKKQWKQKWFGQSVAFPVVPIQTGHLLLD